MSFNNSAIIIIIVVVFAFYLIYSQNNQSKYIVPQSQISPFKTQITSTSTTPCLKCEQQKLQSTIAATAVPTVSTTSTVQTVPTISTISTNPPTQITNLTIDADTDPYADPIKKQDLYGIYDPLTYPQMRMSREILDKYNEFYETNGVYPPFNQSTKPLFDNPILNGILIKQTDQNEPFSDNVPSSVPLFRVKSVKNANRFFYYILDQRYLSRVELKIPLDHVKINNVRYSNAEFYGLPELYDGDIIENIPIYPNNKFKIMLYKQYHFP